MPVWDSAAGVALSVETLSVITVDEPTDGAPGTEVR